MSHTALPLRKDIPIEQTWDSTCVFPSLEAFEQELKAILESLPAVSAYAGKLGESPATLLQAFAAVEEALLRASKPYMYAGICSAVDKTDAAAVSLPGKAAAVYGQVLAATSYLDPELLQIGQEKLHAWMQQAPGLQKYAHYLDDLFRQQAHVRSAEVEQIMGMLSEPFNNIAETAEMLTDADFQFAPAHTSGGQAVPVGQSSFFGALMGSPDRELRRSAWNSYLDEYLAHKNTLASNLAASMKAFVFRSRVHNYENSLEASLFKNNIPVSVFYNLIDTFKKHLPTWQRYFQARRKALQVEQLEPFDMWAPLAGQRPTITFPQAVDFISQGVAPLGPEYVEILRRGCLEQRWVDRSVNQGKISGAFSSGIPGSYPYIVLSYADDILSMSTLAHELGHSMHSYLTWHNQPTIYSDYSLFVAEVASNFHQAMTRAHLLETQKEAHFQIAIIEEAMANFYRYFLIMPTLARFELELHQRIERGQGFHADGAMELMADLFSEAYGDTVHVDRQRLGMYWAVFTHMYADYYVYQYATGISAANALSRRILAGTPNAAQDYLAFLKSGSSLYPLQALKLAGIDMTTPAPVEAAFEVLSELVDRLETLI